jgi:hypothetical protein
MSYRSTATTAPWSDESTAIVRRSKDDRALRSYRHAHSAFVSRGCSVTLHTGRVCCETASAELAGTAMTDRTRDILLVAPLRPKRLDRVRPARIDSFHLVRA